MTNIFSLSCSQKRASRSFVVPGRVGDSASSCGMTCNFFIVMLAKAGISFLFYWGVSEIPHLRAEWQDMLCRHLQMSDMHEFEKQYPKLAEVLTHHNFPPSIGGNSGLPEWGMTKSQKNWLFRSSSVFLQKAPKSHLLRSLCDAMQEDEKKYCIPCFEKQTTQLLEMLKTPHRGEISVIVCNWIIIPHCRCGTELY